MKPTFTVFAIGVTLLSAWALRAPAATATWTGAGADAYWTNAANWAAGVPGAGDDILLPDVLNQTVDLTDALPTVGALSFNAADDYLLQSQLTVPATTLTLGGDVTQSGAGAVTFASLLAGDLAVDLGGASRTFGGGGSGVVRFDIPITDALGAGTNNLLIASGNYVLGSSENTFGQLTVRTGAVVTLKGTVGMNMVAFPSYLGLAQVVNVDGGILKDARTDNANVDPPLEAAGGWGGAQRGLYFGPGGGALMYVDYPPVGGNLLLGGSADWFGGPRFYVNDATNGIPAKIILGQPGSFFIGNNHRYCLTLREGVIGNGDIDVVVTNGAYMGLMATNMTGKLRIFGVPGGDSSNLSNNYGGVIIGNFPDVDVNGYRRGFFNPSGIFVHGALFFWQRHSERAYLITDITLEPGASVDFCGGATGNNRWLNLGFPTNNTGVYQWTNTITVKSGAKANMNLELRPDMTSRGIRIWSQIDIQAGGTLKFYRSYHNGDSYVIETFWPITGRGSASGESRVIVDLPYASPSLGTFTSVSGASGKNGVNFDGISPLGTHYPGGRLVVNGSGDYGLRVEGYSEFVTNLLSASRLSTLTGSGGVLTIAITNNATMDIPNGPASSSPVFLGLDNVGGNIPAYVLGTDATMANFAGLVLKGGTARVNDSATVTMQTLKLAGADAAIQMGGSGGGAVLKFANSSGITWATGTLNIFDWNGGVYGGGPDQIFVGTDATGLTASQLAQIKWINPFGSGDVMGAYQLPTGEIVPAVGQSQVSAPSGGGATDFGFTVTGIAGRTYVVDRTLDLRPPVVWTPVFTNVGPAFPFVDVGSAGAPTRFYRVRSQ